MSLKYSKELLVNLLSGNILVYEDDESTLVPGVVSGAWYDEGLFKDHAWQVSVGPVVDVDAAVIDFGAQHKWYVEALQVAVWVLQKRGVNYTPERLRQDLVQEIDEILLKNAVDPSASFQFVNVSGWSERDEAENDVLRSDLTVEVEYERERAA